jgi:hypothetical protein
LWRPLRPTISAIALEAWPKLAPQPGRRTLPKAVSRPETSIPCSNINNAAAWAANKISACPDLGIQRKPALFALCFRRVPSNPLQVYRLSSNCQPAATSGWTNDIERLSDEVEFSLAYILVD